MAEVWAARDLELERPVALKLLGPAADPARFTREAHAAAALSHPNVTQLFDYGAWEGRPYMVLELLPGGTLEDRLRDGRPLPDAETERIAREIASGLAHAHERGLVHRDLKPANVLFDADGRAKIADFGIARMGGAGAPTEAGTLLGTAADISPEQTAGGAAAPPRGRSPPRRAALCGSGADGSPFFSSACSQPPRPGSRWPCSETAPRRSPSRSQRRGTRRHARPRGPPRRRRPRRPRRPRRRPPAPRAPRRR